MKNYNGVKIDGKICFREDVDAFIRMHKLINLQNKVNNELKWLQSQSLKSEIRPECKIISAPALREYSRIYNT